MHGLPSSPCSEHPGDTTQHPRCLRACCACSDLGGPAVPRVLAQLPSATWPLSSLHSHDVTLYSFILPSLSWYHLTQHGIISRIYVSIMSFLLEEKIHKSKFFSQPCYIFSTYNDTLATKKLSVNWLTKCVWYQRWQKKMFTKVGTYFENNL